MFINSASIIKLNLRLSDTRVELAAHGRKCLTNLSCSGLNTSRFAGALDRKGIIKFVRRQHWSSGSRGEVEMNWEKMVNGSGRRHSVMRSKRVSRSGKALGSTRECHTCQMS